VLVRLHRSEDGMLTMGALADQVAVTSGGVTRLVDRMAGAGLVARRPGARDRRIAYAVLTADGRARLQEALRVHAANLRAVFADFSARELATLDGYLDRLRSVPPLG
jgi:DNA-binding MarR family transcriptional regulator